MIPAFNNKGNLPPGIYVSTWDEFISQFAYNNQRKGLIKGLKKLIINLDEAGCKELFIDGSFVTNKPIPNDYDGCWRWNSSMNIDLLDSILLDEDDLQSGRNEQKAKYKGEVFMLIPSGYDWLKFFQKAKDGSPKGIIELTLEVIVNDLE